MKYQELKYKHNYKERFLLSRFGGDKVNQMINQGLIWQIRPGVLRKE